MAKGTTRREILRGGLAAAGLGLIGLPEWALPALAQGDTLVRFTDIPDNFNPTPSETVRFLDIRQIDGPFTPRDQFYTVQHYGHPTVDATTFRLKLTGHVERPREFSLDDLRSMGGTDLDAGFECSGNGRARVQGLASNGRWTGLPLSTVLHEAGLTPQAREVVFFGADRGDEEVEFRGRVFNLNQQFGRSLTRDEALSSGAFLAYAMNGEPLTVHQGAPLRLVVPGWYGVANVKWLTNIHVQDAPYVGKYQARWYRGVRGESIGGEVVWNESAVTRMRVKSVIARVTRAGSTGQVHGFVLNDGTPLASVEVKVDDGPWQQATMDASTSGAGSQHAWKLFTYTWNDLTPGEHTLVSRATDANGLVQPTAEDLESKLTFLEDNSQFPRTVVVE